WQAVARLFGPPRASASGRVTSSRVTTASFKVATGRHFCVCSIVSIQATWNDLSQVKSPGNYLSHWGTMKKGTFEQLARLNHGCKTPQIDLQTVVRCRLGPRLRHEMMLRAQL